MTTLGEFPITFAPRSVTDSIDGDNSEAGACSALTNLIFDPSTPGILQPRPGVRQLNPFTGFINPLIVSAAFQLNGIVYGMVGSDHYPGKDEPFAYDVASDVFYTVSGVTNDKLPNTLNSSGDWVPPDMDIAGVNLVVTHMGFIGGAGPYFGWFDVTVPTAPVWNAGNTTTNPLPFVPAAVAQFNNRLYFAVKNAVTWTDTLSLTVTNATQTLFIGDTSPVTALYGMPLSTTSEAILQGLMVFKENYITQITGDEATSNRANNCISLHIGTSAPRSISVTPDGMGFMAVDGVRLIQLSGVLTDPNPDLALPFIYALFPSRVSAGFNNNTYRICVQNDNAPGAPQQEYWLDIKRNGWTGPHTFPQDLVLQYKSTFILFSNTFSPSIWMSDVVVGNADVFEEIGTTEYVTEDGTTLYVAEDGTTSYITSSVDVVVVYVTEDGTTAYVTEDGLQDYITERVTGNPIEFLYQTVPITDFGNVYANTLMNSTLEMAIPSNGVTYTFTAYNEVIALLAQAIFTAPPSQAIWGQFIWGLANWGAQAFGLQPKTIPWPIPLVFNRLVLSVSGNSSAGLKLGSFHLISRTLSYLLH